MKNFAIAINSEKEYNKVKDYAEKWGYKQDGFIQYLNCSFIIVFKDNKFSQQLTLNTFIYQHFIKNKIWKYDIIKHSPLTLHNTCVRIDTEERVKEVWVIIKDCGIDCFKGTMERLSTGLVSDKYHFLIKVDQFTACRFPIRKTEISPKQLDHLIRVEQSKKESPAKPRDIISNKDKKVSEIVFDAIFGPKEEEAIKEIDALLFSNNRDFKTKTVERSLRKNGKLIDGILVENIKQLLDVLVTYDTIGWHLNERPIQATMLGNESQSFVIEFKEDFSILKKKENQVTITYNQFKSLNIN